jgi:nitrite transporter NirC
MKGAQMYTHTIDYFIEVAEKKTALLRHQPLAFLAGSIAGGAYVGLGVALIFSIGDSLPASVQKLVMGLTFGLALILVVIAGAELFTGYTLYMMLGVLSGRSRWRDLAGTWVACWLGNLFGAVLVASLFAIGGANGLLANPESLLYHVADIKMSGSVTALLAKGLLCNWLVCLALWMSGRVDSDVAKSVVIFWCLLAFIASGYEHSVANMTLLSLAVIGRHADTATCVAAFYNLFMVTLGNILGGAVMVGGLYWLGDGRHRASQVSAQLGRANAMSRQGLVSPHPHVKESL